MRRWQTRLKKYLILFLVLNSSVALAQSTGPVGPVGPSVNTESEEESTTSSPKPSVDLPYKPSTPPSDKSKNRTTDVDSPRDSPPPKEIPYVLSQSPESMGAPDPDL